MKNKILTLLIILTILGGSSIAQTTSNGQNPNEPEVKQLVLNGSVLKLDTSEIDLPLFEVEPEDQENKCEPEIIMPTSHANEYALIDFSACPNGIYWIIGTRNDEVEKIKIIVAQ